MSMITDELMTFAEAEQRQRDMESELSRSCPEHASKWMLTEDHVKKDAVNTEDVDV